MNKASKILYIIGIIFAVIIVSITFLSMASKSIEGLDFFNRLYVMLNDGYATTDRFAIVLGLISIVLMLIIILLNSKDKILVIASLVISALILNPFPVAASIVLLIEIHAKNREAYMDAYTDSTYGVVTSNERMYMNAFQMAYKREKELVKSRKSCTKTGNL